MREAYSFAVPVPGGWALPERPGRGRILFSKDALRLANNMIDRLI